MSTANSNTRRRGEVLETVLLEAVWSELKEVGYGRLSFDAVAKRANTSKAVLYRRWPNRLELVRTAIRFHRPRPLEPVIDTGSLRGDVLAALEYMTYGMGEIPDIVSGMVADAISDERLGESFRSELIEITAKIMEAILQNATERGEIAAPSLPKQLVTLPIDLARYKMLMTGKPPTRDVIEQIVDEVFLPLVKASQS